MYSDQESKPPRKTTANATDEIEKKIQKYLTPNFMATFKDDEWSTIVLRLQEGLDDTGKTVEYDYNLALYLGLNHKLIHKQPQLMNSNTFSFALKDISFGLIRALQNNNKDLFISINYCLTIAKHFNIDSVINTLQYNQRYDMIKTLFIEILKAMQIWNHWIHHSLTVHGMTYFIINQILHAYNIYFGAGQSVQEHPIKSRLLTVWRLSNKILISYLNNMMHYSTNIMVINHLRKIQGSIASKCGNTKCFKYYYEWKYAKKQKHILSLVLAGDKIKSVNKWFVCKGCLLQYYCCRKCQKYHWKHQHYQYCKNYIH